MSPGDGPDPRKSAAGYVFLYGALALSQWLGTIGQVPFAAIGMIVAPAPIATALGAGHARKVPVLLAAATIAGAAGYRSLGGAVGLLALSALGFPIGAGIRRGRPYGRSVALTALLAFVAICGVLVGQWDELGLMAADTRQDFVAALEEAEAEPSDNLQSLSVLERQIWMMDNWPYLLFGIATGMALIASCAMVSISHNWVRWREKVETVGSFRDMRLPDGLVWVVILAAVLWFVEQSQPSEALRMLSWNVLFGLAIVYWVNGIAVVTFALRAWRPNPLVGAAAILAVMFLLNMLFFVGLFDTWADFRSRIQRKLDEGEAPDEGPGPAA